MEANSSELTEISEITVSHDETVKSAEKVNVETIDDVLCKNDTGESLTADIPLPEDPIPDDSLVDVPVPPVTEAPLEAVPLPEAPLSDALLVDVQDAVVVEVKVSEEIVESNVLLNDDDLNEVADKNELDDEAAAAIASIVDTPDAAANVTLDDISEIFDSAKEDADFDSTAVLELTDTDTDVPDVSDMNQTVSSQDVDQSDRSVLIESGSNVDERDDESDDPGEETDEHPLDTSKDDNNVEVLSSSEEADVPSQKDKWNESGETVDDEGLDDEEMQEEEEEDFEDELDEEESEYESGDESEGEKEPVQQQRPLQQQQQPQRAQPVRQPINISEPIELLSDDDDDYVSNVPAKTEVKTENESDDYDIYGGLNSAEEVDSSDEDDDFGSVNSSIDDSDDGDDRRKKSVSADGQTPVKQSESRSQSAVAPEQTNDKGPTDEPPAEQNPSW